jgi:lipopolysaccharide/colanic/teichoic acid biosynthesis glycosyltransferase
VSFSLVGFFIFRVQDQIAYHFSFHDAFDIVKAVAFTELTACIILFLLTRLEGVPRSTPIIHGLLLTAGLVAGRTFSRAWHGRYLAEDYSPFGHTIVIGANRLGASFIKLLSVCSPGQQDIIAVLDEKRAMIGRTISGVRIIGIPRHLGAIIDEFVVHGVRTDKVIVAGERSLLDRETMREVQRVCDDRMIELVFLPHMIGSVRQQRPGCYAVRAVSAGKQSPFALRHYFWLKRCIDMVGSLALVVLLFPLLMAVALLVLLDVGTPMLFWQRRVGYKGSFFNVYKFRTLKPPFDRDGHPVPKHQRLSAIGRILRATRADELPQLLNVLMGDMSLIGPRPLLPEDQPPNTGIRLLVRPGITGWAQVNGGKLVTREEKEKLDEWYVRNASLRLDLRIVFMTLKMLLTSSYASAESQSDAEQAQQNKVTNWRNAEPSPISSAARKNSPLKK